jgi:glyoxylase-like metal-dependent hydrolase (beta-lactamase superfamily II)
MLKRAAVLVLAVCSLVVTTASPASIAAAEPQPATTYQYGDIVQIAPSTLMVVGRALDVAKGQADVGNAILYRDGDTLYVIDTGATTSFQPPLRKAIDRLRPFKKVVLIDSHGHPDHNGNNALVTQAGGAGTRHYMSEQDFSIADDLTGWLQKAFEVIDGYAPGYSDPPAESRDLIKLFDPMEQSTDTRRAIESLPSRSVKVGDLRMQGWELGGGDVVVLPTRGHTPGSLSFYFPKARVLHMADELNSFYPAFPEASADEVRKTFSSALAATKGNDVRVLTDGHTYSVVRGADQVRARLQSYIDGYDALDRVVRRILTTTPGGATVSEIVAGIASAPDLADAPGGADFGSFAGTMVVRKKLDQLGAIGTDDPPMDRRFSLPAQ